MEHSKQNKQNPQLQVIVTNRLMSWGRLEPGRGGERGREGVQGSRMAWCRAAAEVLGTSKPRWVCSPSQWCRNGQLLHVKLLCWALKTGRGSPGADGAKQWGGHSRRGAPFLPGGLFSPLFSTMLLLPPLLQQMVWKMFKVKWKVWQQSEWQSRELVFHSWAEKVVSGARKYRRALASLEGKPVAVVVGASARTPVAPDGPERVDGRDRRRSAARCAAATCAPRPRQNSGSS